MQVLHCLIFTAAVMCLEPQGGVGGAPSTSPSSMPTSRPAVTQVLWDGEAHPVGVGWVSPGGPAMSIAAANVNAGPGHSGARVISFHTATSNLYAESGWQWAPWSPKFEGTDFTAFDALELSVRVTGRFPTIISLSLASPGDHHTTQRLPLAHYAKDYADGNWHTLRIPLSDFVTPGMKYDPRHTIQIILGAWTSETNFIVQLDDLRLTAGK